MRLFAALDLPPELLKKLTQFLDRLRPTARIQWSPPENLHITIKFIGHWPDERLGEVTQALGAIESRPTFRVHIADVGFFPNPRSPRVFWCGIDAPELAKLAAAADQATSALGIPAETRAFSPHLTLARVKERLDLDPLRRAIAAAPSLEFGSFEATGFFLYQSQPRPTGSVYTKLAEFPFAHK